MSTLDIQRTSLKNIPCTLRHIKRQSSYDVGHGILIDRCKFSLYISLSGRKIAVDVADNHMASAISRVIGVGMTASTVFTGGLPIHGAGVGLDGHYFGILAPSGTGKSTTLWALLRSGALFANDDLIPIYLENDIPIAYPSISLYPKLHRLVLEHEGSDTTKYKNVAPDEDKFWIPISPEKRWKQPQQLSAIFLLQPTSLSGENIRVLHIPDGEAAKMLYDNLKGSLIIQTYMNVERILTHCRTLANFVPVYTLQYRKRFEVLPRLVEAIRSTLHTPVTDEVYF